MRILLTNDDGIHAPGIQELSRAVERFGPSIAIAPNRPLSGCSHQVTTDEPILVEAIRDHRIGMSGTPSDCVRLALLHIAPDVDWVISGINDGGNLGVDTYMSGTVGAAREAALLGRKAMAISQYRRRNRPFEWTWAGDLTQHVLEQLLRRPLPSRCFWNVNLPADYDGESALPDIVFCPLAPHPLPIRYEKIDGAFHYRSDYHARQRRAGADVDICFSGRVSISLVSLDAA